MYSTNGVPWVLAVELNVGDLCGQLRAWASQPEAVGVVLASVGGKLISWGIHSWYERNTHRISELRICSPLRIMSKPEKFRIKVLGSEVDCVLCTAYCVLRTRP